MIFMGVVLKIPVGFACWLIWWAVKSEPDTVEAPEDGGSDRLHFRREPKRPKGPRRGPHTPDALPLPCPETGSIRVSRHRPARERLVTGTGEQRR